LVTHFSLQNEEAYASARVLMTDLYAGKECPNHLDGMAAPIEASSLMDT
jgi:hypothetical protein